MKTKDYKKKASLLGLLKKIHRDEGGALTIETVLIIAAIAIPVLIFILTVVWPRVKNFFNEGMNDLDGAVDDVGGGGDFGGDLD